MSVREYVGARYVPLFATPLEWSNANSYEPLTIVQHEGNSYTSRQFVPTGIDISNEDYWALTGNYNAQIEQYRQEVQQFDERITNNTEAVTTIQQNGWVTADRIADGAVDSNKIADGSIMPKDLAAEYMVVIGDSYSDPTYVTGLTMWHETVAERFNLTGKCYAKAGTGYIASSPVFNDQITQAKNDGTFDNSQVKMVVIYGGRNDVDEGLTKTAIDTAIENAVASFPNALIVVVGVNTWEHMLFTDSSKNDVSATNLMQDSCYSHGVVFMSSLWWLAEQSAYFNTGNGHPNQAGQTYIASRFLQSMLGDFSHPSHQANASFEIEQTGGTSAEGRLYSVEGRMHVRVEANCASQGSPTTITLNSSQIPIALFFRSGMAFPTDNYSAAFVSGNDGDWGITLAMPSNSTLAVLDAAI